MSDIGENTHYITPAQFSTLSRSSVYTSLSVIATVDPRDVSNVRFLATQDNHRTRECSRYLTEIFTNFGHEYFTKHPHGPFTFTLEGVDVPNDTPCVSWQKKWFYRNVVILPDFYYTYHHGYIDFMSNGVLDWDRRVDTVFWRGTTTGFANFGVDTIDTLPRYRFCRIGQSLGDRVDFKFCNVAQTRSEQARLEVERHLLSSGLLAERVPMEYYTNYKYFVQIDGNGNSWEIVKKLRLGCCMLLVESDWLLWHNPMLRPWKHYVPIKNDLSDLAEIVEWCTTNQRAAREIAENGRRFALAIDFKAEMEQTIKLIVEHADVRAQWGLNENRI